MKHPEADTLLAHADGELDGKHAAAVAAHVASCDACRAVVAGLGVLTGTATTAFHGLDRAEPADWAVARGRAGGQHVPHPPEVPVAAASADAVPPAAVHDAAPGAGGDVLELRPRRPATRTAAHAPLWRWAAGFVLMTGAAAAAAILGGPLLRSDTEVMDTPTVRMAPTAAQSSGGGVGVELAGGAVDIVITGAAPGTRVRIGFHDDAAAWLDVSGVAAPHFVTAAGAGSADLGGAAGVIELSLPAGVRSAVVRANGRVIATAASGTVTATEPAGGIIVETTTGM